MLFAGLALLAVVNYLDLVGVLGLGWTTEFVGWLAGVWTVVVALTVESREESRTRGVDTTYASHGARVGVEGDLRAVVGRSSTSRELRRLLSVALSTQPGTLQLTRETGVREGDDAEPVAALSPGDVSIRCDSFGTETVAWIQ